MLKKFIKGWFNTLEAMTRGSYTRDIYFIPTILYHDGDGIYARLELAWLKWYIGFCWVKAEIEERERRYRESRK